VLKLKRKVPHAPIFFPGRAPRSRDKKEENVVIGLCAFTGPPDPEGVVEITYSVAPSYQGKGCATEAVIALLAYANHSGLARTIRAHTLAKTNASTRVLEKCTFKIGEIHESENNLGRRCEGTAHPY